MLLSLDDDRPDAEPVNLDECDPEAWTGDEEHQALDRDRKKRQRRSLWNAGIEAAKRFEEAHRDTMAINRLVTDNGRYKRLSEAAAARRRGTSRKMVSGLPMTSEAVAQEAAVEKTDRRLSGGSDHSNTDPAFRHFRPSKMETTNHLGGLDWLDLTVYGNAGDRYYDQCKKLLEQREAVKATNDDTAIAYIGNEAGSLFKGGLGSGFNHCPLVWKSRGIQFRFGADRRKADGTAMNLPLMFVDIPGTALLTCGEIACLAFVSKILGLLGVDSQRIRVRRVDLCLDMVGEYRERWQSVISQRNWVTKGSAIQPNYTSSGKFTGFQVKGGTCSLTVYDKAEQIRLRKPEVLPAMVEHRWHGDIPDEAWRVEFRIRPGKSQSLEFRSIEAVLNGLKSIVDWASCSWFRLVKNRQVKHTERCVIDDLWQEVIHGFWGWADTEAPLMPRVIKTPDPSRVLAVALGCLVKCSSMTGIMPSRLGLDQAVSDMLAIYLRGEGGVGLEGTTEAERQANFQEVCAGIEERAYRQWVEQAAREAAEKQEREERNAKNRRASNGGAATP